MKHHPLTMTTNTILPHYHAKYERRVTGSYEPFQDIMQPTRNVSGITPSSTSSHVDTDDNMPITEHTTEPNTQQNTWLSHIIYKRLLFDYVRENKWTVVAFAIVIMFTLPVESVLLPYFYSRIFEGIRSGSHSSTAPKKGFGLPSMFDSLEGMWKSCTRGDTPGLFYTVVLIWMGVLVAYIAKHTLIARITPSYMSFVRQRLFAGVVELHSSNYKDIRVGEEVTRIMDVSRNMKNLLCWVMTDMVPVYLATLLLVLFLSWISPVVGGVAFVGLVVHTVVFVSLARKSVNLSATREHYYLQMSEKLHDSFGNLMNVYLNNMKQSEITANRRTEAVHGELMTIQYNHTRNLVAVLMAISVVTFLFTIGVTYNEVRRTRISTASFIAVWIVILLNLSHMLNLSSETPQVITQLGILQCSNEFLTRILQSSDKQTTSHIIRSGEVVFKEVSFSYRDSDTPTLFNFNLSIKPNEKVGILGTSGSGKTTAMKLLSGMYKANDGLVQIDGVNVSDYDVQHLRQQVNYVNQRTQLFNTTVLKNIQYGNSTSTQSVKKLLAKYELQKVYDRLTNGLDSNAGVNGSSLSLGMQKVTMLVRGLLREGKVIILDEPLAGLDSKTREKVLKLIADTCQNKTLIVITHDREIIPMMDRVVNFGEINHPDRFLQSRKNNLRSGRAEGGVRLDNHAADVETFHGSKGVVEWFRFE